ncbi:hypothetical protein [Bradyrhizobium genosp. P]|uniref:hypothetical protein n=1 Tax=Bradyrhizobium genosp. P TaxID=83641 RepID=UPI003CF02936
MDYRLMWIAFAQVLREHQTVRADVAVHGESMDDQRDRADLRARHHLDHMDEGFVGPIMYR